MQELQKSQNRKKCSFVVVDICGSIHHIQLPVCVLIKSCKLSHLKTFGLCLKPLSLMFVPNWSIVLQYGILILRKTYFFIYIYLLIYSPIMRKQSKCFTSSPKSSRPSVYHTKMGESR